MQTEPANKKLTVGLSTFLSLGFEKYQRQRRRMLLSKPDFAESASTRCPPTNLN